MWCRGCPAVSVPQGHTAQFPGCHNGNTTVLTYEAVWLEKWGRHLVHQARSAYRPAPRTPHVKDTNDSNENNNNEININ